MKPSPTDSKYPLFQLDYKCLALLLLPTFLRQSRIFALLSALTAGVSGLHSQFIENQKANIKRIKRNGQVCYLRALLNDELDRDDHRITVTDGVADGNWMFAFSEDIASQTLIRKEVDSTEDDPAHILYSEALIIANTALFIIFVPWLAIDANKTKMLRNLLNEHKLLSKKYTIRHE